MVVLGAIKKEMVQKVRRPHVQLEDSLAHTLDELIKNNLGKFCLIVELMITINVGDLSFISSCLLLLDL